MSFTWGSSVADGNISGSTIAGAASLASASISNSGKAATELYVILTYGAGTLGAKVEILRTDDGTTFQVDADSPFGFNLPFTASTTIHYVFTVPATISQFKLNIINLDASASITSATLKVRQATN